MFSMNMTSDGRISVPTQRGPVMITKDHHSYPQIVEAFKNRDVDRVLELYQTKQAMEQYVSKTGNLYVQGNDIWVRIPSRMQPGVMITRKLNDDAASYLIRLMQEKLDVDYPAAVIERCYQAASDEFTAAAISFIFQNKFETPLSFLADGRVMGYKRVRDDFTDIFSGKLQYVPLENKYPHLATKFTELVKQPGEIVYEYEDKLRFGDGCGGGLHVGNFEYVKSFYPESGVVISVIFDPADVVGYSSVSTSSGKLRVRKLECGFIIRDNALSPVFDPNYVSPEEWDEDEDDCDDESTYYSDDEHDGDGEEQCA